VETIRRDNVIGSGLDVANPGPLSAYRDDPEMRVQIGARSNDIADADLGRSVVDMIG
jgi:hypothetical protein